jgi:SHS2 domain-containing protein
MVMKFKFLKHTADVKFQAFGNTLEKAFENSVLALKETIARKIKVKPAIKKKIKVEGKDKEALLYNFLEEFLFLLDAENFLLSEIEKIKIEEKAGKYELEADIVGDSASNYKFTNDVKAITYNEMFVKQEKNKYACQVVVDV